MESTKNRYVAICPRCYSQDISNDIDNPALASSGNVYGFRKCNDCGFSGGFFPEVEQDNLPDKKIPDKSYPLQNTARYNMDFLVKLWRITGPVLIVISILLLFTGFDKFFFPSLIIYFPFAILITIWGYYPKISEKKWFKILYSSLIIFGMSIGIVISYLLMEYFTK